MVLDFFSHLSSSCMGLLVQILTILSLIDLFLFRCLGITLVSLCDNMGSTCILFASSVSALSFSGLSKE